MQLSNSLARLSQAVGHTADLCELLKSNLDAMRTLASSHAAQYALQKFGCYGCQVLTRRQVHDCCSRSERRA